MDLFPKFIRSMSHSWRVKTCSKMHTFKFLNLPYSFHKHVRFHSQSKNFRSTIFALSTAPGVSAIAVIRISGPGASDAVYRMGKVKQLPESRKAVLCRLKDPISEELLDKALVLWFPSPNSFTGEDMCEFHVHGGVAVVKSILSALMKIQSFRLAEPGEFTKRAFLANKLDLTEIEGLSNLLHAETETQQRQALRQMDGVLNKLYTDWSNRIKKCLANIEAYIDFSEDQHLDNTIVGSVQEDLDQLKREIGSHLSDFRRGERLRNGVYTALIGKPNVGKSSLLNSLCQRDIAIVSPTAGTTRDVIETSFNLGGHLVNISDTAGIRDTEDLVEMEGVKRAKDRLTKADLLIVIFEAKTVLKFIESDNLPPDNVIKRVLDAELGECFVKDVNRFNNLFAEGRQAGGENDKVILLLNKVDLLSEEEKEKVTQLAQCCPHVCSISCTEGTGMEAFLNLFSSIVKEMCLTRSGEEPSLTQERHRVFVQNCLQNILEFEECMDMDAAIAAEKLRIAMNELGKITGKVRIDDILDVVFRDFCIGK